MDTNQHEDEREPRTYTIEERVKIVANLLAMNRRNSMAGRPAQFNHEALLSLLVAPDWFIDLPNLVDGRTVFGQLEEMCPIQNEPEKLWLEIQFDIDRYFPGQFNWDTRKRNGPITPETRAKLEEIKRGIANGDLPTRPHTQPT